MPTVSLVVKNRSAKDGLTPVYLQYMYDHDNRTLIQTNIRIPLNCWNSRHRKVKDNLPDNFEKTNEEINIELATLALRLKKLYTDALKSGVDPTISYIQKHFSLNPGPEKKDMVGIRTKLSSWTIYDHIDDYIKNKKDSVARDTVKDYNALKKHLKGFSSYTRKQVTFNSFDYAFYDEFVNYLYYEAVKPNGEIGLFTNSVGKQIKNLKAFLRERTRVGHIKPIDLSYYKTVTEDVDLIYLERSEIATLYHLDLSMYPDLIATRDWLVLGCLIGLRFSDLSRINPQQVVSGNLRIEQQKTKKPVEIPIYSEVRTILEKYKYTSPISHLNEFNYQIKMIGSLAKINAPIEVIRYRKKQKVVTRKRKHEFICSHTCRRSFCTNEYLSGTSVHLIMKISGHKTEKAFLRYLKMDEKVAAIRLRQEWENRKSLLSA
jgi:hypothetical protein